MKLNDSAGRSYTCTLLTGKDNYMVWSYTLKEHLTTANLIHHVDPTIAKQEPEKEEDVSKRAQEAKSMVISSLASSEVEKIVHCSTAQEIWSHFKGAYGKKTANEKLELMIELNSLTCKDAKEVSEAVNKALTVKGKLVNLGVVVDSSMVICALIRSLPPSYANFLDIWDSFDVEDQTLERFLEKLSNTTNKVTHLWGLANWACVIWHHPRLGFHQADNW